MNNKIVHILGSYSGYNKGDLAILISIIEGIHRYDSSIIFYIVSKNPKYLKSQIPYNNIKIFKSFTSYLSVSTPYILWKTNTIIIGGGGLFFSRKLYNPFFNHIINLFIINIFNKLIFKRKIYIFSVGCSHLNSPLSRKLTQYILNQADQITVRDKLSYQTFSSLTSTPVQIFFDPVLTLPCDDNLPRKYESFSHIKILIIVNSSILNGNIMNIFIEYINTLSNVEPIILTENCHPFRHINKIYPYLKNKQNIHIIDTEDLSPKHLSFWYSSFPHVITFPMHGLILSYNYASYYPVTIAYDDKVNMMNNIIENPIEYSPNNISKIKLQQKKIQNTKRNNVKRQVEEHFSILAKFINS